ncbi:vigilin-like isoform X1 [Antennarius striatus]|uniref:vigilin-like isoform X1 n=1 Tax=Antennarius striatus TaxID=241820 RepID=UPI0035B31A0C
MRETGAYIHVPSGNKETEIVVTGNQQQVDLATARINEILEDKRKNTTTIAVVVKKSLHQALLGPAGDNLEDIMDRTGVSVEVPPADSSTEAVTLRGQPTQLVQALTDVCIQIQTAEDNLKSRTPPQETIGTVSPVLAPQDDQQAKEKLPVCENSKEKTISIFVPVNKKSHAIIIGQGGLLIKRIREETKTIIHVPPQNSKSDVIVITGTKADCEAAQQCLMAIEEELALKSFKLTMTVEPRHFPKIIGYKGVVIKKICDEHDVRVRFPDDRHMEQDQITIIGTEKQALAAQNAIQAIVNKQTEQIKVTMTVDPKHFARIIGIKGVVVKSICNEHDVKIRFPGKKDVKDQITIVGGGKQALAAQNAIQAIVSKQVSHIIKDIS